MTLPPAAMKPCDVCGGELAPYRHAWLRRCRQCRTLGSDLPVAIPDQAGGSVLDEALRESGLDALRRINNVRLLDAVGRQLPAGARLLDVGCGPGFLLQAAAARGFRVLGLEPDANVVPAAAALGEVVRHGYFPAALSADERFDVIVFNDVLEHIPALDAALAASAAHLNPGGLLLINCPDRRGLFFRVAAALDRLGLGGAYDRLWQRGLPSPHVWYLTPAALARAAGRHDLHADGGLVRLKTVALEGLWNRIRFVKGQSLTLSLAALAFAIATLPLARLFPADASASLFRKPR
jgi:SAM-dependent methyltransferase